MDKLQAWSSARMCLSPDLFSLYTELIMRNVIEGKFKVNGHSISVTRYADDRVLISDDQ